MPHQRLSARKPPVISPRGKCQASRKRRRAEQPAVIPQQAQVVEDHDVCVTSAEDFESASEGNDYEEPDYHTAKKRRSIAKRQDRVDLKMEVHALKESVRLMEKQVAETAATIQGLKTLVTLYAQRMRK